MRWNFSGLLSRARMGWSPYAGMLWAVQCLACVAIAWIAAQTIWWLATPSSAPLAGKASLTLVEQSNRVTARHFFDVEIAQRPAAGPGADTPPGGIDPRWRLLGTYVDSGGKSRALLVLEGSAQVVVAQIGDRLPSGHTVMEVLPERIVLDKASQRSELTLRPTAPNGREQEAPGSRSGMPSPPPPSGPISFTKDPR